MDRGPADALTAAARLDPETPVAILRTGATWTLATDPVEVLRLDGPAAFAGLDALAPGFWAGFLTYELGHAVERVRPRADHQIDLDPRLPDLCLVRFARTRELPATGPAGPDCVPRLDLGLDLGRAALGPAARSTLERAEFLDRVETVLEHIRAGDCYQVNLTRTLAWDHAPDPLALFAALTCVDPAPHAAFLRLPTVDGTVSVVSASPERFLSWQGRTVETRPIKGTATHEAKLRASAKDRAENVMIVDLARNDLGRVCVPGSVHVPGLCEPEARPGLVHLVSTVRGTLRAEHGLGDLVRATFPPASVTGAPKPAVLQRIEDLEPTRRGVYCGAIGWIDTARGCGDLAVAIRTFTVASGRTTFGVGSGIVADSDPAREWDETRLKARRILAAATAHEPAHEPEPIGAHA